MKAKHLIIGALLFGGMTAFTACSNDEIDNVTPPVEQPAEAIDTYLAISASSGKSLLTRAAADLKDVERVHNYAVAVFDFNTTGGLANCLAIKVVDGTSIKNEALDFYVEPIKFKAKTGNVAVVILANCRELLSQLNPTSVTTFDAFNALCEKHLLNLSPMSDKAAFVGNGFPMSSDVYTVAITAGKYNVVDAETTTDAGIAFLKTKAEFADASTENTVKASNLTMNIPLYRSWSQVELTDLNLKTYNGGVADFKLEEVFMMNVPAKTKSFNESVLTSKGNWGGNLGYGALTSDLAEKVKFVAGYNGAWQAAPENATSYRSEMIADNTTMLNYYLRDLTERDLVMNSNTKPSLILGFNNNGSAGGNNSSFCSIDEAACSFVIPESDYGKTNVNTSQMIVLVVKGKYSETAGGITTGGESSYYAIPVNLDGAVQGGSTIVHNNEVIRNVKYEISATIAGPGSKNPDWRLPTSILVPKVTIVPFGSVKQSAEID